MGNLPVSVIFLCFLDEFFLALRASDSDFSFASGDADGLTATGTLIILVFTVTQAAEKHEKTAVFLIPFVSVARQGAENGNAHQRIRYNVKKEIRQGRADENGNNHNTEAGPKQGEIQLVRSVTTCHKSTDSP